MRRQKNTVDACAGPPRSGLGAPWSQRSPDALGFHRLSSGLPSFVPDSRTPSPSPCPMLHFYLFRSPCMAHTQPLQPPSPWCLVFPHSVKTHLSPAVVLACIFPRSSSEEIMRTRNHSCSSVEILWKSNAHHPAPGVCLVELPAHADRRSSAALYQHPVDGPSPSSAP
ncbi:hypothetical protein VTK73DRAFT_2709 [Phialemonium thermophilum]|uniref:Uncharacterized protein n=1 Tax=Phialemonium thermophilum TaxID=223376 RepID=A0ABR3VQ41_9PEZI